ncbi:MAG: DUF2817 domain-containing protein [Planctomycetota bacterium]
MKKASFYILLGVYLFFIGCGRRIPAPTFPAETEREVLQYELARQDYTVGYSAQNRPIECITLGYGLDVTFILAAIHGDEPAGIRLIKSLDEYLQKNPSLLKGRTVVLVPAANPDGLARKKRGNSRKVDLNRNFPTSNRINCSKYGFYPFSEPEARVISEIIKMHPPSRIISLHQPYGCIDYDGPGLALAKHITEYCSLPLRKLGALPGSLGSYAGEHLGIPIITVEMHEEDSKLNAQSLWGLYGDMLLAAVMYPEKVHQK